MQLLTTDCLRHTAKMAVVDTIIMAVAHSYCYELLEALWDIQGVKSNSVLCKALLFCVRNIIRDSNNIELA